MFSALHLLTGYGHYLPQTGCGESLEPAPPLVPPPLYLPPRFPYSQPVIPQPVEVKAALRGLGSPRRPRSEKRPIPEEQKDERYYERRKRNNQAAKKSRDARRLREDQIALRASMLEHENAILRAQVLTLREEAQSLRELLLHHKNVEDLDVCTV